MKNLPRLLIKNMVCPRCVQTVEKIFQDLEITADVALGEAVFERPLSEALLQPVRANLEKAGFEIIETRVNKIIEDIKMVVSNYLAAICNPNRTTLSTAIKQQIPYDYSYLSDLFSSVEGKSIEQYFIVLRIEKVKELIVYDQLSFTEIADRTGFSSVHHLSSQFKKVTGLTPSHFKTVGATRRKPLDWL